MPKTTEPLLDATVLRSLAERLRAQTEERNAFRQSAQFQRMVEALKGPGPRQLDAENYGYFPERTLAETGLEFASAKDVRLFLDVLGDENATTVTPDSRITDETCPFENFAFEHFGLMVDIMIGQGSSLTVYNAEGWAQALARQAAYNEKATPEGGLES